MNKAESIQYLIEAVADKQSAKKAASEIESAFDGLSPAIQKELIKAFDTFYKRIGQGVLFPQATNFARALFGGDPEQIQKQANSVLSYVNGLYKALPDGDKKIFEGFDATQLKNVAQLSNEFQNLKNKAAEAESKMASAKATLNKTTDIKKVATLEKTIANLEKSNSEARIRAAKAERDLRDTIDTYAQKVYSDDSEQSSIFRGKTEKARKNAQKHFENVRDEDNEYAWGLERPSTNKIPAEYKKVEKYLVGEHEAKTKLSDLLNRYNKTNLKKGIVSEIPSKEDMQDIYGYYSRLGYISDTSLSDSLEEKFFDLDDKWVKKNGTDLSDNSNNLINEASKVIEKIEEKAAEIQIARERLNESINGGERPAVDTNVAASSSGLKTEQDTNINDKTPSDEVAAMATEQSKLEDIASAAQNAVGGKNDFVKANEALKQATEQSNTELQKEADLMADIAANSKAAAGNKDILARVGALEESLKEKYAQPNNNEGSSSSDDTSAQKEPSKKKRQVTESERRKEATKNLATTLSTYEKLAKKVAKGNGLEEDLVLLERMQKKINRIQNSGRLSNSQLQKSKNQLEKINKEITNIQSKSQKKSLNKMDTSVNRAKVFANNNKVSERNNSSEQIAALNEVKKNIREYDQLRETIGTSELIPDATLLQMKNLETEISNAIQKFKELEASAKEISRIKLANRISDYMAKNTAISSEFRARLLALQDALKDPGLTKDKIPILASEFEKLQVEIRAAGQEGKRFFDVFKTKVFYNFAQQISIFFSLGNVIQTLKTGISVVRELDTAFTEMRKVSDDSDISLQNFQKTSFNVAEQVGATAQQIQNSAADFMRLGYSLKEASSLSKDANIYANVGDMDIDESTEHMISSIKAWGSEFDSETEASSAIVDRYNEVGNNFAITSADIGEAMERSAAALKAGGNTLNESLGLITAGNLIQQDADTTANALKVLSLRIRGAKTDLESMGEDVDDLSVSSSKLRDDIKGLTGVDIMMDDTTFKSTAEIVKEIGAVWNNLNDITQANVLEKLAGKQRASVLAGLLENYKTIDEVIANAQNSEGSAQEENERYMDSIEGRIKVLTTEVEKFWFTFIGSDSVKATVTGLSKILSVVTKIVDTFGSLPAIGGIVGGIMSFQKAGREKCFSSKYACNSKVSYAKYKFYLLSSVKYTVEFADMASLCIWTHPLMIEGHEVA